MFWSLTVKLNREDGFHVDLDDYLMGLLQLASELVCSALLSLVGLSKSDLFLR